MNSAQIRITLNEKTLQELEEIQQKMKCKTKAECCRKILETMVE